VAAEDLIERGAVTRHIRGHELVVGMRAASRTRVRR
jgi:hypothetical protein